MLCYINKCSDFLWSYVCSYGVIKEGGIFYYVLISFKQRKKNLAGIWSETRVKCHCSSVSNWRSTKKISKLQGPDAARHCP